MQQNAIYTLILCIIVASIVIKQCLLKQKILKYRLFTSFILIFIVSAILFFYDNIKEKKTYVDIGHYTLIAIDSICLFFVYLTLRVNLTQKNFIKQVTDYLDETKIYCIIDNKDRIKEISSIFTSVFAYSKEDLYNMRFFEAIDNSFEIIEFNGEEVDNDIIKRFYKDYQKNALINQKDKREIVIITNQKEKKVLNVSETAIFVGDKYKGRFLVGDIISDDEFLTIEKELNTKHEELSSIKYKFISTLEITSEAIFFKNLDSSSIWLNENLTSLLKLKDNSISIKEFNSHIYPDDLIQYNQTLAELTPQDSAYEITYRFNFGENYHLVKEKGKRIFENSNANEILGHISLVKTKHYEKSNIEELDDLLTYNDLLAKITLLYKDVRPFEVVAFRLSNIPDINYEFGRDIGNMFMGNYIGMIKNNLISEDNNIFRISGLEFIFIITDVRLMEKLSSLLQKDERILHVPAEFGSIKLTLEAHMGSVLSKDIKPDAKELVSCAMKALRFSQKEQYKANFASYKDVI